MIDKLRQKLSGLFSSDGEDRGVSPVIGVILMVAITVILAAVIGAFVLGLGDEMGNTAPNANLALNHDATAYELQATHNGGEDLAISELTVVAYNDGQSVESVAAGDLSSVTAEELSTGERIDATYNYDGTAGSTVDEMAVIHEPSGSKIASISVEEDGFNGWATA